MIIKNNEMEKIELNESNDDDIEKNEKNEKSNETIKLSNLFNKFKKKFINYLDTKTFLHYHLIIFKHMKIQNI